MELAVLFHVVVFLYVGAPVPASSRSCGESECVEIGTFLPEVPYDVACRLYKEADKCFRDKAKECRKKYEPYQILTNLDGERQKIYSKAKARCSQIILTSKDIYEVGEPLHLVCNVTGAYMTPTDIIWFKNGIKIRQEDLPRIDIYDEAINRTDARTLASSFEIGHSAPVDNGFFKCSFKPDSLEASRWVFVFEDGDSCKDVISCLDQTAVPAWRTMAELEPTYKFDYKSRYSPEPCSSEKISYMKETNECFKKSLMNCTNKVLREAIKPVYPSLPCGPKDTTDYDKYQTGNVAFQFQSPGLLFIVLASLFLPLLVQDCES